MSKEDKEYDLEGRLIDFAVRIIEVARSLPKTKVGNHNKSMASDDRESKSHKTGFET
jgi:hypothetical protein